MVEIVDRRLKKQLSVHICSEQCIPGNRESCFCSGWLFFLAHPVWCRLKLLTYQHCTKLRITCPATRSTRTLHWN